MRVQRYIIGASILSMVIAQESVAQFQGQVFQPDTSFAVFGPGGEKSIGFSGGFNTPQLALGDLNDDGKDDLVVFEKGPGLVRTFINYGTAGSPNYRYRPEYQKHFPRCNSYLKLIDYNCDEVPDLLTRGLGGFSVYRGSYANGALTFSYYKDLYYSPLTLNEQDFEFTQFPPPQWKQYGQGWSRVTSGDNPYVLPQSGSGMGRFNSDNLSMNSTATLVSKPFRISAQLGNHGSISFWMYRDDAAGADSLSVYISHDTTLNNAYYIARIARQRTLNQPDTKPVNGWYEYNFQIPSSIIGNPLYLIFKGISKGGNNIYIDKIKWISSPPFGDVNAYVDPGGDIPGVADVDGDGDLDFFAFNISGAYMNFYKNYRVEDALHCDSIRVNLKDACWGKVYQGWDMTQTLGINCDGVQPNIPPAKTTHTGNTLCFLDYDADGDYDYLNGSISFSNIQFLRNGKVQHSHPIDTIIAQDTMWGDNGHVMEMVQWPAAFWLDFDQDGKKDLMFSPNADNASENYRNVSWYRNTGTASSPSYTYQGDSVLAKETIEAGAASYPMLYDYNKDGKPDLFVGGEGFYQSNGTLRARMSYYENTSTAGNPAFTLVDEDFLGLFAHNFRGIYPAVGDLNNDGKDDLVIGHSDGTLSLYKNNASGGAVQPDWQLEQLVLTDKNSVNIDSVQHAAPFIYDIDKDGKKDLLIGGQSGWIFYYKNTGNTNELKLEYQTNRLGMAIADPHNGFSGYSVPFIGRIDNSPNEFLLIGSNSGSIYRYTGFQNGNVTVPYQMIDTIYSEINGELGKWSGMRSAPAVADIDGDGKYEMVVGNILGGVNIYKQVQMVNVPEVTTGGGQLQVFPNPAKEVVYVGWGEELNEREKEVGIYSITGQKLVSQTIGAGVSGAEVSVKELAAGTYVFVVTSGKTRKVARVVVLE